jgi:hypothetical protein
LVRCYQLVTEEKYNVAEKSKRKSRTWTDTLAQPKQWKRDVRFGAWNVSRASQVTLCHLQQAGIGKVSGSCDLQLALFTTERQRELWLTVALSKTRFN